MASLVWPNATLDDGWIQHPEVSGPRWLSTDVIASTAERADHRPPSEFDKTTPFTPHTVRITPPFDDFGLVVSGSAATVVGGFKPTPRTDSAKQTSIAHSSDPVYQ